MSDDATFDGYDITTVNPGVVLLLVTFAVCLLCFILGFLLTLNNNPLGLGENKTNNSVGNNNEGKVSETSSIPTKLGTKNDNGYYLQQEDEVRGELKTRRKSFRKKKRYGRIMSPTPKRIIKVGLKKSPTKQKAKGKQVQIIQVKKADKIQEVTRIGRYEEKLHLEDFLFWNDDSKVDVSDGPFTGKTIYRHKKTTSTEDLSVLTEYRQDTDEETTQLEDNLDTYEYSILLQNEMKKLFGLAAPWVVQSVLTDFGDIIYMMLCLSHFVSELKIHNFFLTFNYYH